MDTTQLVILRDYTNDQKGYTSALGDGAVYVVQIDEASYSAMYNVSAAIKATCECLGYDMVSIGLVRNKKYIPLSVIEDTSFNSQLDYQDLAEAFEVGLVHLRIKDSQLAELRTAVDASLSELMDALPECEERKTIDHCVDCIDQFRVDQLKVIK